MTTENKEKRFIATDGVEFFDEFYPPTTFYPLLRRIVTENLVLLEQEKRITLRAGDRYGGYYGGDDFTMYLGKPPNNAFDHN